MTEGKPAKRTTAKRAAAKDDGGGFSAEERAAMKARAEELRAEKRGASLAEREAQVLAKIAEMPDGDRRLAERIHAIVLRTAPDLQARLWYGMPAYAKDGKVLCFFQSGAQYKSRYCTFGFQDVAALDEGTMWATGFALTDLTPQDEERIAALVTRAMG
ncbi:MAG: DUF1801 domain-containing protein [Candidatus Nanopelagicales bacterium]|nr:DUF1801 domain-containing protein [Candidatus Nanopelagicales bacterium]